VGVLPALLTVWIYASVREPETGRRAPTAAGPGGQRAGRLLDLFAPDLARKTLLGLALAMVGLATYWGVFVEGRQIYLRTVQDQYLAQLPATATGEQKQDFLQQNSTPLKHAEMLGMIIVSLGGGLGLVGFGPICERLGRRGAFLFYTLGGALIAPAAFQLLPGAPEPVLWLTLPIFGFFATGMHGGFAIYFPELFPTRLRATGGSFCFNGGRLLAAPILIVIGWMQNTIKLSPENTASLLSLLFLAGAAIALFAPETKGRELPS
jgi:hypothetical protein